MLNNAGKSFGVDAVVELRAFADRWLDWLSHHGGKSVRGLMAKVMTEISMMTRNYILYMSFGVMVLITLFMHLVIHALFRIEHPTEMAIMLFSVHVLLFVGMMLMAWAPPGDNADHTSQPPFASTPNAMTPMGVGSSVQTPGADPVASPLLSSPVPSTTLTPTPVSQDTGARIDLHPLSLSNQSYRFTLANVALDHPSQAGGHLSIASHKTQEYPVLKAQTTGAPSTHAWKFKHVVGTSFWHIYCERLTENHVSEHQYLGSSGYRDPLSSWIKLTDASSAIKWRVLMEHRAGHPDDTVYIFVDSAGRTLCSHSGHNPPANTTWVNMHMVPFTSLKSAHWHVTPVH